MSHEECYSWNKHSSLSGKQNNVIPILEEATAESAQRIMAWHMDIQQRFAELNKLSLQIGNSTCELRRLHQRQSQLACQQRPQASIHRRSQTLLEELLYQESNISDQLTDLVPRRSTIVRDLVERLVKDAPRTRQPDQFLLRRMEYLHGENIIDWENDEIIIRHLQRLANSFPGPEKVAAELNI